MVYIITTTGCSRVGKTYVTNKLIDYITTENDYDQIKGAVYTIDSSFMAKNILQNIYADQPFNWMLRNGISLKTDEYRNCLMQLIHAFDTLDIRFNNIISAILKYLETSLEINKHKNVFIFVNIREAELIERIGRWSESMGYIFHNIFVLPDDKHKNDETADTDVDNFNKIRNPIITNPFFTEEHCIENMKAKYIRNIDYTNIHTDDTEIEEELIDLLYSRIIHWVKDKPYRGAIMRIQDKVRSREWVKCESHVREHVMDIYETL